MADITRSSGSRSASSHGYLVLLIGGLVGLPIVLSGGCAAPQPQAQPKVVQAPTAPTAAPSPKEGHVDLSQRIAEDPVTFLREVAKRTSKLESYRLTFYRQERLGFPPQLGPMEQMEATFRQDPFSVKFTWPSEDAPYYESVYVQNANKDQILVRERKGALPFLPPTTRSVDVMLSVKIGKSKNPITDFGLRRIMERTLLPFDDPELSKIMTVTYKGIVNLEPMNRPVYYLQLEHPKVPEMTYTRQDLYFDTETLLPAGTDLYLPGNVLDASYRYANVQPNVPVSDADFRLTTAKLKGRNGSSSQPAS